MKGEIALARAQIILKIKSLLIFKCGSKMKKKGKRVGTKPHKFLFKKKYNHDNAVGKAKRKFSVQNVAAIKA